MEDMVKVKIVKKSSTKTNSERLHHTPLEDDFKEKNVSRPKNMIWFMALLSVIVLFFSLSYLFSKATVTIIPHIEEVAINENLSADKDSSSSSIPFDLVVISGEESKKVATSNKEHLEVKAKGNVVLYNNFSTKSQNLNIDTQLEGSNGKIYKINKRVVVPGLTKDGKPGKIEVGIYGAGGGESYNSAPLDFKILYFKNTPKYTKIYGRSKDDITGGVKGDFYTITTAEKDKVASELKDTLQAKLLKKTIEQIPKGFILFKDAVFLNINNADTTASSKENLVPISIKGTLYGFVFDEKKLTKKIAKDVLEKYDDSDVYISNIKDLAFLLPNKENISFSDVKNINFVLKGNAKIVWKFNAEKFATDLLGKDKKDFSLVLLKYPNVTSATPKIKPFWRMAFPNKSKDIKVIVNYPL